MTTATLVVLAAAAVTALARALRPGSRPAERVLAIDLYLIVLLGWVAVQAAVSGDETRLEILPVLGLVAAIATVAAAAALDRPARSGRARDPIEVRDHPETLEANHDDPR